MPILFILVVVLGVIYLIVSRPKKEGEGSWVQFFSKGKEAGFSFKEIDMLRQLTIQCGIEPPHSIFESQIQFDKCIHFMVRSAKMSGSGDQGTRDFLSKLYDYRQKIEVNKNRMQNKIAHSRQISEGQALRILVVGTGVFDSHVVKNAGQYMTIARPAGAKNTASMSWAGLKIAVYFWREDDAGYVFDSEVLDEVYSLGTPSLKITHGESLFRTQKRKSVRAKTNKAAFLYLVPSDEPPHKLEARPGVKCLLEDLSDTGCAVTIGGKATEGLRVKVQFALDNVPVCVTGTVRSTSYREDADRTVLRIEAEPLPMETKNHILSEVFGMLPDDDEDELPFRVLDDEMATLSAGGSRTGGDQTDSDDADSDQPTSALMDAGGRVSVNVSVGGRRAADGG